MKEFRVHVADAVLDDLRSRLGQTRWPDPLPGPPWTAGLDRDWLRLFCQYWRTSYDWRQHEARLNRIQQFKAEVDGVDIHFMHVKARGAGGLPLLLLHGWPGSIIEFEEILSPLADPIAHGLNEPAFELVIPSIPGFGFSGKPVEPGWGADRIARAFHTLMTNVLGIRRYGLQGGDWGTIIATRLASLFPGDLAGLHLNMPFAYPPSGEDPHVPAFTSVMEAETGYLRVQSTRPDALTLAQTDSPAGLAAWILEKFHAWSDHGGDLDAAFGRDRLITNLMFYWATNSAASAARIYFESTRDFPPLFLHQRIEVPTAFAVLPHEPYRVPRHWLEPRFNIESWSEARCGGHFAAMEQPEFLVHDMRRFFAERG
jgi:epoxide hydrolase